MHRHIYIEDKAEIENLKCMVFFLARQYEMLGVVQNCRGNCILADVQGNDANVIEFQKALLGMIASVTIEETPPLETCHALRIG
ncbi:MAG: hypothetical protein IJ711_05000 [Lachnospiraceae bacterium]|nr:hypothetical protein [Lachnospiraceae bacterium]